MGICAIRTIWLKKFGHDNFSMGCYDGSSRALQDTKYDSRSRTISVFAT